MGTESRCLNGNEYIEINFNKLQMKILSESILNDSATTSVTQNYSQFQHKTSGQRNILCVAFDVVIRSDKKKIY